MRITHQGSWPPSTGVCARARAAVLGGEGRAPRLRGGGEGEGLETRPLKARGLLATRECNAMRITRQGSWPPSLDVAARRSAPGLSSGRGILLNAGATSIDEVAAPND